MEIKSYVSKEFFHQAGGNSIIILIVSQLVTQKIKAQSTLKTMRFEPFNWLF